MPDWEAEGLLESLDDERDRAARRELLELLYDEGVSVGELRTAVAEERLVLVPVERALGGAGPHYTLAEVVERAGADEAIAERNLRASGVPVPAPADAVFDDADVDGLKRVQAFLDAGLDEDRTFEMVRVATASMARLADATRVAIGESLLHAGDTELDLARRYAGATRTLAPLTGPALEYAFNYQLREAIRSDAIDRAARTSGRVTGGTELAACFADLVGFTRLGEEVPPDELGGIVDRLGDLALQVARRPVSLIKLIGDAAMLVSPEPKPLLDAALAMVDAGASEGGAFPPMRAGIAIGTAVNRGGDWYGRPVNLASRITSVARPNSVLVADALRDAVGEDAYAWSYAGRRQLKGVRDELRLFRARPAA